MSGSFDIVYSTLCCYKSIHGNVKVPYGYVISEGDEAYPEETWGINLGQRLRNIRHTGSFNRHKQQLLDLGVDYNTMTRPQKPSGFDVLCSALSAYKAVFANLKVPECFVIAEDDERFPEETWGMKLGQLLDSYIYNGMSKAHKLRLIDLGVEFKENSSAKPAEFDLLFVALTAYKEVNGIVKVPCSYVISECDKAYPKETWGMKLGQKLSDIRYKGNYKKHKQQLIELGVDFKIKQKSLELNVLLSALSAYKAVFANLKVPDCFVIDEGDDRFPQETWGMKLGLKLWYIKYRGKFNEQKQKLTELGVDFTSLNQARFQSIQPEFNVLFTALTAYKVVHGDVKVPFNYVISEGDAAYPEEAWGMQLGVNLMSIRHAGAFQEHKHKLIDLGVDFSSSGISANKKRRRTSE